MEPISPLEPPAPEGPVFLLLGAVAVGLYVLFAALAVADHAPWAALLAVVPAVLFLVAGLATKRLLRRR